MSFVDFCIAQHSRFWRFSLMSRNSGNWLSVCCQTGAQVKVLIAVKVIWLRRLLWARIHHASHCVCWPFARCHTPPPPSMFLRPSFFTSITAHLQGVATISFHFCGGVGMSGPCWLIHPDALCSSSDGVCVAEVEGILFISHLQIMTLYVD